MVNDRKLKILKIIIDDFIDTAQPVGSRTIAKKYPVVISSATIRNEMADLEDLGYLRQPHTSAGRIPSDLAFRLYVDSMMDHANLGAEQRHLVKKLLLNNLIGAEDIAKEATNLLNELTGLTTIVTMPQFRKSRLTNMKLIRVDDAKVLLIMISDTGIIKTEQLTLANSTQGILDEISNSLFEKIQGSSLEDINLRMLNSFKADLPRYSNVIDYLIPIMRNVFKEIDEVEVYIVGQNSVFDSPEFQNMTQAKKMLDLLHDKNIVYNLLKAADENGLSVKIGSEIGIPEMNECCVISASYRLNGKNAGYIGVVGSKRMDYGKVIGSVDYVKETLSEIFSGINL